MTLEATFERTHYNCRECGDPTNIVYSKIVGERRVYVCGACNEKPEN